MNESHNKARQAMQRAARLPAGVMYFGENMELVATQKHVSEYPNPFYLKQGDKVALGVIDDEYPNWIFITSNAGEQGWAPVQYIEKIEGSSEGILLQDYDNVELNTVIGEKLSVLFELNSWYRVSSSTGEKGWVPVHSVQRT
ncbi:SH3 domain-containing protein [Halomonas sp. V046]|uniref:SH3 domain-containing protein n=1 Tax=Halomonas sp. V046 TaxID=3459611 RepID=UPI0040441A6E